MTAAEMTTSNHFGIIAAYEWQPEIEGFFEGVNFQNPSAEIHMDIINDWNDTESAADIYESMKNDNVDVFYPTGDMFSRIIIQKASSENLYTIDYVEDQAEYIAEMVLTSTRHHMDKQYALVAEQ